MAEALSRVRTPAFLAGLSAQGLARLLGFGVTAVTAPLVARHLGPAGYGEFTIVVTVLFLLAMLGEFGLPLLASREWPQLAEPGERHRWLASFWSVRHLVTALTLLLGVAVALVWPFGPTTRGALLIGLVGLAATLTAGGATGLFTAAMDPAPPASFELGSKVSWLVAVGVVIFLGLSVAGVVGALVFSQVVGAGVLLWITRRRELGPRMMGARIRRGALRLARRALPLAPLPILGVMYARADVLILAFQGSPAEVGVYGVIWRILELLMMLVGVVSAFFLPVFASCRDQAEQRSVYRRSLPLLAAGMVTVAVVVAFLARPTLLLVGGSDFLEPTIVSGRGISPETSLVVVMGAFALMSIGNVNGSLMLARRLHRPLVRHFLLALGVNVALALMLIPHLSHLGAAGASLGSEAVAALHSTWIVRRELGPLGLARALAWPMGAGAAVAGGLMAPLPFPGRLALAALLLGWVGWMAVRGELPTRAAAAGGRREEDRLTGYLGRLVDLLDRRGPLEPHNRRAYAAWLLGERIRRSYYRRRARSRGASWPPPDPSSLTGLKVNLGSGEDRRSSWTNIDLRPVADLVATAERLPLRDDSVEYLAAHDLLEHFWRDRTQQLLSEWRRVLGPDGWLELKVPNLLRLGRLLQTDKDPAPFLENIYGGHRWGEGGELDMHHWGWTPATLERDLEMAGFHVVTNDHAPNMTVKAVVR